MKPTAPSWFSKKLRAINATLGVRHTGGPKGWQIVQYLPQWSDRGVWRGGNIKELVRMPHHVGFWPGLGSKILFELPRHNTQKYRGYEEFCKELNIPYQ